MLVRAGSTDSKQNEEALGHQNRMRGRAAGAAAGAAGAPADAQRIAVGGGAWTKETRRHSPRGGSHWRGELSRKGVRRESEAGGSRTPSTLQASAEQKGGAVEKAGVPQAGNSPASRSHPTGRGAARGLSTTVLTLPRA